MRVACWAVGTLLLAAGAAESGAADALRLRAAAGVTRERGTKVSEDLLALRGELEAHVGSRTAVPFLPSNRFLRAANHGVTIDAVAADGAEALLRDLEALGLRNGSAFGRMVSGRLPIEAIEAAGRLQSLRFVRPAYMATRGVGRVEGGGTLALRANEARSLFRVDGTGVTVGTLSDSFNCLGGASSDVVGGDLPPGVGVLEEISDCEDAVDEGRALMQVVADIAPGAGQKFHTAFNGMASFARGIIDLAAAGARVIHDDVIYFAEPMFQDGIVAQAVDKVVKEKGVTYFAAAGNEARNAYESAFRPSGRDAGFGDQEAHDFDPGPGTDIFQRITVPQGSGFLITLQWDQPFFSVSGAPGSTNDIDIILTNDPPIAIRALGASTNPIADLGSGDPVEIFAFFNPSGSGETKFNIAILRVSGSNPGRMKWVAAGFEGSIDEFDTASGTCYGHPNAKRARAVGAAFYASTPPFGVDPAVLEPFSSAGGTAILFTKTGVPVNVLRQKPEIVAPDGVNTTFFGSGDADWDGFTNFFGTSAAVPHAAGVAALLREANPDGPPQDLYSAMQSTADDMGPPGFDFESGFGLIRADLALGAVALPNPAVCKGLPVTIFGSGLLRGTSGPDVIKGRLGNDTLFGLGGGDSLCGAGGNDTLKGGGGDDRLAGQAGNDRLVGGGGSGDECSGGPGADTLDSSCETAAPD